MKIGIVLSAPPTYSETFFNSKIEGLLSNGHEVTLFTQKDNDSFGLCPVKTSPRVFRKNPVFQLVYSLQVFIGLLAYPGRLGRFYRLEKGAKRSLL